MSIRMRSVQLVDVRDEIRNDDERREGEKEV